MHGYECLPGECACLRLVRNRIFLHSSSHSAWHCPSRVSLYRVALFCDINDSRADLCRSTHALASRRGRKRAGCCVSHACLRLRRESDDYSRSREIAISRYKKMSAMVEGWYRRTLGPHSCRAFSSECSCPIAFSLTSTEYDLLLSDK